MSSIVRLLAAASTVLLLVRSGGMSSEAAPVKKHNHQLKSKAAANLQPEQWAQGIGPMAFAAVPLFGAIPQLNLNPYQGVGRVKRRNRKRRNHARGSTRSRSADTNRSTGGCLDCSHLADLKAKVNAAQVQLEKVYSAIEDALRSQPECEADKLEDRNVSRRVSQPLTVSDSRPLPQPLPLPPPQRPSQVLPQPLPLPPPHRPPQLLAQPLPLPPTQPLPQPLPQPFSRPEKLVEAGADESVWQPQEEEEQDVHDEGSQSSPSPDGPLHTFDGLEHRARPPLPESQQQHLHPQAQQPHNIDSDENIYGQNFDQNEDLIGAPNDSESDIHSNHDFPLLGEEDAKNINNPSGQVNSPQSNLLDPTTQATGTIPPNIVNNVQTNMPHNIVQKIANNAPLSMLNNNPISISMAGHAPELRQGEPGAPESPKIIQSAGDPNTSDHNNPREDELGRPSVNLAEASKTREPSGESKPEIGGLEVSGAAPAAGESFAHIQPALSDNWRPVEQAPDSSGSVLPAPEAGHQIPTAPQATKSEPQANPEGASLAPGIVNNLLPETPNQQVTDLNSHNDEPSAQLLPEDDLKPLEPGYQEHWEENPAEVGPSENRDGFLDGHEDGDEEHFKDESELEEPLENSDNAVPDTPEGTFDGERAGKPILGDEPSITPEQLSDDMMSGVRFIDGPVDPKLILGQQKPLADESWDDDADQHLHSYPLENHAEPSEKAGSFQADHAGPVGTLEQPTGDTHGQSGDLTPPGQPSQEARPTPAATLAQDRNELPTSSQEALPAAGSAPAQLPNVASPNRAETPSQAAAQNEIEGATGARTLPVEPQHVSPEQPIPPSSPQVTNLERRPEAAQQIGGQAVSALLAPDVEPGQTVSITLPASGNSPWMHLPSPGQARAPQQQSIQPAFMDVMNAGFKPTGGDKQMGQTCFGPKRSGVGCTVPQIIPPTPSSSPSQLASSNQTPYQQQQVHAEVGLREPVVNNMGKQAENAQFQYHNQRPTTPMHHNQQQTQQQLNSFANPFQSSQNPFAMSASPLGSFPSSQSGEPFVFSAGVGELDSRPRGSRKRRRMLAPLANTRRHREHHVRESVGRKLGHLKDRVEDAVQSFKHYSKPLVASAYQQAGDVFESLYDGVHRRHQFQQNLRRQQLLLGKGAGFHNHQESHFQGGVPDMFGQYPVVAPPVPAGAAGMALGAGFPFQPTGNGPSQANFGPGTQAAGPVFKRSHSFSSSSRLTRSSSSSGFNYSN